MDSNNLYKLTRTWKNSLGPRSNDQFEDQRAELRNAFDDLRIRANQLASTISTDLPNFTLHDLSHIDALWEMADLLIPESVELNPAEGFVLGAAFCTHDLGLSFRAYDGGIQEIASDLKYLQLLQSHNGSITGEEAITADSTTVRNLALADYLRLNHATKSLDLTLQSWNFLGDTQYLIDSTKIRMAFGHRIGKLSHSHWQDLAEVLGAFEETVAGPGTFPPQWSIRELYLALVLRCADAIHLDDRRAPAFSRCLQKPNSVSNEHWVFQAKLLRPTLLHNFIKLSSSSPFRSNEAQEWWLCYETAKVASKELRESEFILSQKSGYPTLSARGVYGSQSPEEFSLSVECDNWVPVDASARISDLSRIICLLGSEQLYGPGSTAPLREILSNAFDANRALATFGFANTQDLATKIEIDLNKVEPKIWVEDQGIGMTKKVLAEVLLDFGKSHWSSELNIDTGGSLTQKLASISGRYGLGFFSTFGWCTKIRVTSRYWKAGVAESFVLEIFPNSSKRPILRRALHDELRLNPGTQVELSLTETARQLFETRICGTSKAELVLNLRQLCYCSNISLKVLDRENEKEFTEVISPDRWKNVSNEIFLRDVCFDGCIVPEYARDRMVALADNVRELRNEDGQIVGRAALYPRNFLFRDMPDTYDANGNLELKWFPQPETGKLYLNGMYSCQLVGIAGILTGLPSRASRDMGDLCASNKSLRVWGLEQSELLKRLDLSEKELVECAMTLLGICGEAGTLPVCRDQRGFHTLDEIADNWKSHEILFLQDAAYRLLLGRYPGLRLLDSVLVVDIGMGTLFPYDGRRVLRMERFENTHVRLGTVIFALIKSFAIRKGIDLAHLAENYLPSTDEEPVVRVIGHFQEEEIKHSVNILSF